MTVEFIGMIHHREASEIHPPANVVLDRGYIRDFAQAAEAASFDKVLVGYFSDSPDGFLVAASAAAHTEASVSCWRIGRDSSLPHWRRASLPRWIRSPADVRRST
jgi:hypothetical protein